MKLGMAIVAAVAFSLLLGHCAADEKQAVRDNLREPIFRVTKIDPQGHKNVLPAAHPLDEAIRMAEAALVHIDENVKDYTCTIVKRERINDKVGDPEFIRAKIRHKSADGKTPFSFYFRFSKPDAVKGREVLYVAGENNGKIFAHEGGWKGRLVPSIWLAPTSSIAMRGNRYPATEVGVRNLCARLIQKGNRDRQRGECEVKTTKNVKINDRACTCIRVEHPKPRPYFDFHVARIYVDDEYNIPVRYEAYDWPKKAGGRPLLLEEYTYLKLKFNVGLTDEDFDKDNRQYNF